MSDGAANDRAKNAAMAAYMKNHPNSFPDSVMKEHSIMRHWNAHAAAKNDGSRFYAGIYGGVMAHRLGYPLPRAFHQFV